ncbi:MAG: Ubiquinone/menaquinone biosynthesis C-methyltransferase UbiE [Acidobacteria bacterium]|nr:Ubiquinone/menaquinone biosynthesis C-methyltransferase UbiE [Acidobacteriota bacterium]
MTTQIQDNDIAIAPCLASGPIAGAAREAVLAARNIGDTPWASFAMACAVPYLFNGMERGFNSGWEPVGEINRSLENLASFFALAAKIGFGELASPSRLETRSNEDASNQVEAITGEHYARLFENFSTVSYWDEPAQLLKLRLDRNGIDLNELPRKRVLDAGCGNGRYTAAWRLIGARQAVGVDISPLNIATAQRRVEQLNINGVTFEQGNVLKLPFPDNSFDIVFSNGVLHHTVDWRAGVAECVRTLKPGGLGWLYLIENPGGLFWDVIEILRVIAQGLDRDAARNALRGLGTPANRVFYMLDHVMVPINIRLTPDEIIACLEEAGATEIKRLTRGSDFDRIERIHRGEPFAEIKYGVGENRFIFSK